MVINSDNYQIVQKTNEETIIIYKDGAFLRAVKGKPNLKYNDLVKVLELYKEE